MAKTTKMVEVSLSKLKPYANNAKTHGPEQVEKLKESINEFGFISPCLIDKEYNIIAGHGRVLAAKELGLKTVPCVFIEGLTDTQRRAYILADNRLTELGGWDMDLVEFELRALDDEDFVVELTGFDMPESEGNWFEDRERYSSAREEGNDEYNAFVEKFEPKKTTDDCYTPDNIYDAVADFVANEFGLDRKNFVRPFYPGGDYQKEIYGPDTIVVDNPPFSILAEIVNWYMDHDVKFWLFAPCLTLFGADRPGVTHVPAGCSITYENGANVCTGFKTNLWPEYAVRSAPKLGKVLNEIDKENTASDTNLLKYVYPKNIVTSAKINNWAEFGVEFKLPRHSCKKVAALDAQKAKALGIFGSGFLISTAQAAQAAQALRARMAAMDAGIDEIDINEDGEVVWKLSDRELDIIAQLDAAEGDEA